MSNSLVDTTINRQTAKWWSCPDWCALAGKDTHRPDQLDSGATEMYHDHKFFQSVDVRVMRCLTQALTPQGIKSGDTALVYIHDSDMIELAVDELYAVAADLTTAAGKFDLLLNPKPIEFVREHDAIDNSVTPWVAANVEHGLDFAHENASISVYDADHDDPHMPANGIGIFPPNIPADCLSIDQAKEYIKLLNRMVAIAEGVATNGLPE